MPRQIRIKSNDRVFIAGATGSGKTFAARIILRQFTRLLVFDSKGDIERWDLEEASEAGWKRLEKGQPIRMRISKQVGVSEKFWVDAMVRAYEAGNNVSYIDEASQIFGMGDPPQVVKDIWQRGRAFGVGGVTASQRPARIPLMFMSEAQHYFMFRLGLKDDRKRMAEFMGDEVIPGVPPGDSHGFFYRNISMAKPVYIRRLTATAGDGDSVNLKLEEATHG